MGYLNNTGLQQFFDGIKERFVDTTAQELTTTQQTQVRTNIGLRDAATYNVANDLTTSITASVLDARQGKALKDLIDNTVGITQYTHAKTGTVHNFVGTGSFGCATLTADYVGEDTFTVNGTEVDVCGTPAHIRNGGSAVFLIQNGVLYLYSVIYTANTLQYSYTGNHELINEGDNNWKIRLLTSGTLTFLSLFEGQSTIDAFLVGGGSAGACWNVSNGGGGGGGGYTVTSSEISITVNTPYSITIGAGGTPNTNNTVTSPGGSTSAFGSTANGASGQNATYGGGNGGSGGCGSDNVSSVSGGTDGSNGGQGGQYAGGIGQGSTTREFAEAGATLYSTGGSYIYGVSVGASKSPNTGDGGNGGNAKGGSGGSGIVVIRNHREV